MLKQFQFMLSRLWYWPMYQRPETAARYILTTFLCLALSALPGLSQTEEIPADTPASQPLWLSQDDLIEHQPATISPARAGSTDILSCPFEALRAAYLSLYDEADALNVAALESEVFKVCIERQKQVKQLLDNEERLRTHLRDVARGAASNANVSINTAPTPTAADSAEQHQQDTPTPNPSADFRDTDFRETRSTELAQSALPQCTDRYTSGPVFGGDSLDGGLHAFVFDALSGTRLTVKAGDTLPGGLTIARISSADGVIILEQDVERSLARTLAEPAFDDGGGLLFKTVSFADVYKPDSPASGTPDSDREGLK